MCFAVRRGDIKRRLDSDYYHPERRTAIDLICSKYTAQMRGTLQDKLYFREKIQPYDNELPYIGLANVESEYGNFIESNEENPEGTCRRIQKGDILYGKLRPYLNKVHMAEIAGQCSPEFYSLYPKNPNEISGEFVAAFLMSRPFLAQTIHMMTGNTHPRIQRDDFNEILLPLPPVEKQRQLVSVVLAARESRKTKLSHATALLADIDNYILNILAITQPKAPKKVFAVKVMQLTNALNTERYRGMQLEQQLPFSIKVGDVANILDSRCSPEKEGADIEWDWIRIDDLPNHPWNVETIRTEYGCNIQGTFFEVSENDILIARLGPTIQNSKFVLCPPLKRRTVASPEFLVLRCNKGWNPETVLWILRTKIYREIMYARSRGGTPSRYRLDADDLPQIPFPDLPHTTQQHIAKEVCRRRAEARRLRQEAEAEWSFAKKKFEEELLGGTA
jgi:type I restriction enzyme S subunit